MRKFTKISSDAGKYKEDEILRKLTFILCYLSKTRTDPLNMLKITQSASILVFHILGWSKMDASKYIQNIFNEIPSDDWEEEIEKMRKKTTKKENNG